MAWSEWKKFGSYSKYHYDAGNSTSNGVFTVNKDVADYAFDVLILY